MKRSKKFSISTIGGRRFLYVRFQEACNQDEGYQSMIASIRLTLNSLILQTQKFGSPQIHLSRTAIVITYSQAKGFWSTPLPTWLRCIHQGRAELRNNTISVIYFMSVCEIWFGNPASISFHWSFTLSCVSFRMKTIEGGRTGM